MLLRRVASRMLKYDVKTYDEYLKIVEKEPGELDELVNSLSINVTEFFRNSESFNAIRNIVIPHIVAIKRERKHKIIKAWSCGCSHGDEPYSLAMLFLEKLGSSCDNFLVNVIGSDIDCGAINEAKNRVYTQNDIKALDDIIVKKYFEKADDGTFRINNTVADMVRFRCHDVINAPPFMHCDVILCRNLLIYFNRQLQEETLLKLFDCLNPGGFLVLGMTESLCGSAARYFEVVDNKLRIYRRPEKVGNIEVLNEVLSQGEIDNIVKRTVNA